MSILRRIAPALLLVSATLTGAVLFPATGQLRSADDDKPTQAFEFRAGDRLSILGNTLADRMQHDGWLEAVLQNRFPKAQLAIRNLGFSGDELTIRLRSADFGSPDKWMTSNKTDVVFAFFGYNESFQGPAGVDKFKKDLEAFLKQTQGQKYNGKSAPRIVLFSPIAHENTKDRNLPDGSANNIHIELYTQAMSQVAQAQSVRFVDLYQPTRELYSKAAKPLTINGVHLNEEGNRQLALIIERALFGKSSGGDAQRLEKIRQAVVDKNFYWFNRYRTTDGYSIFGGRADLKFTDGQTNRDVAQREMEVLDVMTANRDKAIWAVANGRNAVVDDSNTPPFVPVKTNKPGAGPNGTHIFLDGTDAISKMTLAKGLKVNLFASEKEFPEIAKPVQMAFDTKGRLWVAVWPSYPHWKPKEEMNDKLLVLEDTDGDGKADKCTVFADKLHNPTGFEFYNGGVLLAHAPDLMFLKDTDGDGRADVRSRVLSGLDSADTHHTSNSFVLDPGGAVYFQEGTFHHTQVETPYGPPERCANAGVFRYEPRSQKFDVYITFGFANPHGHVFDAWGQDIVVDGTGANPFHAALFSGHMNYPMKHARPPQVYQQRTRPCPGMEYLSSKHFPEEMQGNLLVGNVIGFQGILRYKIEDKGSSFAGTELEPMLSSTDPSFRPSDLKVGPDGALYFLDWQNPIIGHMQHNLRDPSRDRTHGRIYRVIAEGRPLNKPAPVAGEPIEKLLDLLKEPEDRVRSRAKIELGARDSDAVIAATKRWLASLNKSDPNYEHHRLEGLWVHQYHNVVNVDLLMQVLASPDFRARAAATRVLCYWRDRVPESLEVVKRLAADKHARVRLEAVRAASFFPVAEAVEAPLISADYPTDVYLEFTRGETMKTLEPLWRKAMAEGRAIAFRSDAGARYLLRSLSNEELLKMKRDRPVYLELLFRAGLRDEQRKEGLAGLAKLDGKTELRVLLDAIESRDDSRTDRDESVVFDLVRLLTTRTPAELSAARGDLEKVALRGISPVTRQIGFVALIAADGDAERAWKFATKSLPALRDLMNAMPLIRDPAARAALYPKVLPLLDGLPAELASSANTKNTLGRYVRIEMQGRKTLSLAEVEVQSNGKNVARQGRATQKNTASGGDPARAIDGNRSGVYGGGSVTHTEENTNNPWWEVDLGAELPIESVTVYNRTDDGLGKRLQGFHVKILDKNHQVVHQILKQPAPAVKATFELGAGDVAGAVRQAAMTALTSVRGQEGPTFKALARFVREGRDRAAALQALQRVPAKDWPREDAQPLLDSLVAYLRSVPAKDRTTPEALDAMQVADSAAALLPVEKARQARRELGELGIRVLRLGAVPDQMLFDKDRLVVKAGKPFEIVFENNDIMPHNFALVEPGALEEIGLLAEATATQPGAQERHYIPVSKKILLGSRLLQPRDAQKLAFVAPAQPGIYPYVCTYPGHWRRMYGALYVVDDLDDYLADAEGYLAKRPLPVKDELLKFNRPRKEWKFEELAPLVAKMDHGRSFNNAKQIFQVASCVSCHKLNGVGVELGPDLAKLDPKTKALDILREMLDPSAKINEKFQTYVIETNAGKVATGLIVEENVDIVRLIENPLAKSQPIVIRKTDIAERKTAPTSIMPKGLLDKLTAEEILDLIAYVAARGDAKDKLFQGGHAGHQH